jgi:hypothetical protein
MTTTGHCLCGAVQFEYDGAPTATVHCHCESCRRQTSSPVATFVLVPRAALRFTCGEPREFASSPGVLRSFCGTCGSPIAYRTQRRPDIVDLFVGALTDPSSVSPTFHVHTAEQLPWFEVLDDLPRYPQLPGGAAPVRRGAHSTI